MQHVIRDLLALGPFPPEKHGDDTETSPYPDDLIDTYADLLEQIERPVTDDEARALITLFGPDTFYGLAAVLMALIETAPGWPLVDVLQDTANMWVAQLRHSAEYSGLV